MLTDKDSDMRMCKHCDKAFVASRKGNEFCNQKCKNQFNVYKSREKKKRADKFYSDKNICCHILQNTVTMIKYTWALPKRVAVRLLPK